MRTRTRLTTPPGEEPTVDDGLRVRDPERYSPALALPDEPDVPGRFRRPGVTLAVLALLAVLGYAGFQLANAGQFQDPSLDDQGGTELDEAPAIEEPTPAG
ncbi:MAG: hypothetical protein KY461_08185 [Actinobacteria bacterium]|nr:hypothetical protein [Actinomycetota bacterium]